LRRPQFIGGLRRPQQPPCRCQLIGPARLARYDRPSVETMAVLLRFLSRI